MSVRSVVALLAMIACSSRDHLDAGLDPSCNSVQSDENCFCDVKDWGAGASWCASLCDDDGDCPSPPALRCYRTYCSPACTRDDECPGPGNTHLTCDLDAGACDLIP